MKFYSPCGSLLMLVFLCSGTTLNGQAINDECAGATEVVLGINSIDTLEATNSPEEIPTTTCPGTALGGVHSDVWFQFTPVEDGLLTVTTCDTVDFDTDVIIYSGICGALDVVACHGDSANCLVQGTTNSWNTILADVSVISGETYILRIGGWADFDIGGGTFELSMASAPPPPPPPPPGMEHDECDGAFLAVIGDNIINSTDATDSSDFYTGSNCNALGEMNQDLWFQWTSPGEGSVTVNTCGSVNFDTDLVVYSGSCNSKVQIACSGDVPGCTLQGSGPAYASRVEGLAVSTGEPLLFRIGGWGGSDAGEGTFSLQFVPALLSSLILTSIPGSATVDAEATLVGDCDAVEFEIFGGPLVQVSGPFSQGDVVSATLDSPSIQTMVEVCATPLIGGAPGEGLCSEIAVTGPVSLEGCSSTAVAIPDGGEPVESTIEITGDPDIILWDLQIDATIAHDNCDQLIVEIYSGTGTLVTLHDTPQGSSGPIDVTWWQSGSQNQPPFDSGGWMQPVGDLSAFTGSNPIGQWTLSVSDEVTGEVGVLEEWCLRIYDTAPVPNTGQDLIIGDSNNLVMVGREGSQASFGSESVMCNGGTEPLDWFANPDPRHPMMAFNMFRLDADRLIQIGGSWVKHGWSSAQANACGFGCNPSPTSTYTGVGCSDTYGASGNANQNTMGPRSEINPWTGGFVYEGSYLQSDSGPWDQVEERLWVEDADLDPTLHPGSTWISEVSVVHPGDIDHVSNHAWEPIGVSGSPGGNWSMDMSAPSQLGTVQAAWPGASIEVAQPFPPIDGRCYLAHKVTDNGDGTWHYEYSIYNHDMSRNVGSLRIPVASNVEISNIDFHAPVILSVEFSGTEWSATRDAEGITWATTDHASGNAANPIRWGFLYNFGFDADAPPEISIGNVGVHAPSAIPFIDVELATPPTAPPAPTFRRGLCNGDDSFDIGDVIFLLGYLFSGDSAPGCFDACDTNDDGDLNIGDGISMLDSLFSGATPPAPPGPGLCGEDPTEDPLDCTTPTAGCP